MEPAIAAPKRKGRPPLKQQTVIQLQPLNIQSCLKKLTAILLQVPHLRELIQIIVQAAQDIDTFK
jgi:hypothetical protein